MPATLADIQRKYGESVYPLYKDQMHEPYMENDSGKGYMGVVMYDELEDKTQCSICGEWFKQLGVHVVRSHKYETANEYKNDVGISDQTPICSKGVSTNYSETIKKTRSSGKLTDTTYKKGDKRIKKYANKAVTALKKQTQSMVFKNKRGLCDAQIATRLVIARDILGKDDVEKIKPTELLKVDKGLYYFMKSKYGSILNGAKALGIATTNKRRYLDSELIAFLRDYVIKHKTIPMYIDGYFPWGSTPSNKAFIGSFGSWRRAKMMAGLEQLLAEVKGK